MENPWGLEDPKFGIFAATMRGLVKAQAEEQALQITFAEDQNNVPMYLFVPQWQTITFDDMKTPTPELGSVKLISSRHTQNATRIPVWFFLYSIDLNNLVDEADCRTRFRGCAQAITTRLQEIQKELNCPGIQIWLTCDKRVDQFVLTFETSGVAVASNGQPLANYTINA